LFPDKVYNVYARRYYLIMGGLSENWTMVLDNGTYNTIHLIIGEIQRSIVTLAAKKNIPIERFIVQIRYSNRLKRVRILFTKYALNDTRVYFSEHLASMLSFDANKYYYYTRANADNEIYAERPVLLSAGTANVYVYCDLLEHVMVGDIKAPIVRIVNRTMDVARIDDTVEHTAFNPIQYVPLQKKFFDTIDILLAMDEGLLLPFVPGKAIVVVGVSLDGACISPLRHWSVTIGHDEEKNVEPRGKSPTLQRLVPQPGKGRRHDVRILRVALPAQPRACPDDRRFL